MAAVATAHLPAKEQAQRWWSAVGSTVPPPVGLADSLSLGVDEIPDALGLVLDLARDPAESTSSGAFYTPPRIADELVARTLEGFDAAATVADLAVGAGAFLLAAARHKVAQGENPADIVEHQLMGVDLDELALAVARTALARWTLAITGEASWIPPGHLVHADGLRVDVEASLGAPPQVIVGNPPFLGQLKAATARSRHAAAPSPSRTKPTARGYADTAMLFLERAVSAVADGGRVCLILPESTLAARDSAAIRASVEQACELRGAWFGGGGVFRADVRVWAPILERAPRVADSAARSVDVARWSGGDFTNQRPSRGEWGTKPWAALGADVLGGVPKASIPLMSGTGSLGELAHATAGFRRHFYALADSLAAHASPGAPRLYTVGSVDPAHDLWDTHEVRFAGRLWDQPCVDMDALRARDASVAAWVAGRARPKVLVASQGSVLEAIVDTTGKCVPSTPLISVEPSDPADVWKVAAMLCSPVVVGWMYERRAGSGLAPKSMRVTAADLLGVPIPVDEAAWEAGAAAFQAAQQCASESDAPGWQHHLDVLGQCMAAAYGVPEDDPVVVWWRSRRPAWKTPRPAGSAAVAGKRARVRDDGQ